MTGPLRPAVVVAALLLSVVAGPPAGAADRGAWPEVDALVDDGSSHRIDPRTGGLVPITPTPPAAERLEALLPASDQVQIRRAARPTRTVSPPDEAIGEPEEDLDERKRRALRSAGWVLPETLAGGFALDTVHALDHAEAFDGPDAHVNTLQAVYAREDGTTLSVFQRPAPLDVTSLPEGAEPVEELDAVAIDWPGADPPRLAWEVDGVTFVTVGGGDREALLAAAEDLPMAPRDAPWSRVVDRLGRWLERMSP